MVALVELGGPGKDVFERAFLMANLPQRLLRQSFAMCRRPGLDATLSGSISMS
jgi:hypothetical protein